MKENPLSHQLWWLKPSILVLRKQRQVDLSLFQAFQGYTVKLYLKQTKSNKQTNQTTYIWIALPAWERVRDPWLTGGILSILWNRTPFKTLTDRSSLPTLTQLSSPD